MLTPPLLPRCTDPQFTFSLSPLLLLQECPLPSDFSALSKAAGSSLPTCSHIPRPILQSPRASFFLWDACARIPYPTHWVHVAGHPQSTVSLSFFSVSAEGKEGGYSLARAPGMGFWEKMGLLFWGVCLQVSTSPLCLGKNFADKGRENLAHD